MNDFLMVYVPCEQCVPVSAALEVLSKGVELAKKGGLTPAAVLIGSFDKNTEDACASYGAKKIIEVPLENYGLESYGRVIVRLIEKYSPVLLLSPSVPQARDVMAYAAVNADCESLCNITELKLAEKLSVTAAIYGGAIYQETELDTGKPVIALISNGAAKKKLSPEKDVERIQEDFPDAARDLRTAIRESVVEVSSSVNLEEAEIIVACGRGMATEEGYKLVKELAELLGASIGATRPVVESGMVAKTQQIGQSGKIVSPKLYIGCGVSGAVQHLSGVLGSDFIVAINKDEDASIFEAADVGLVGDGMEILPILTEEIRKLKK